VVGKLIPNPIDAGDHAPLDMQVASHAFVGNGSRGNGWVAH
jgi:hypothetical protein